jgi:hypothetical protein
MQIIDRYGGDFTSRVTPRDYSGDNVDPFSQPPAEKTPLTIRITLHDDLDLLSL